MSKVLGFTVLLTACMVLYVHGQIAIFKISYEIHEKSRSLEERSEAFRQVKYEVEKLKAPQRLEQKIQQLNLDLSWPREVQVVRIPSIPVSNPLPLGREGSPTRQISPGPFDFMSQWIKVAQAKMDS